MSKAGRPMALTLVDSLPTDVTRTWLGPQYWANRLADWRLHRGRVECLTSGVGVRTVGVLTRSVARGDGSGSVEVRTGTLTPGRGFSGLLIGAGGGGLDWRAAALVMGPSGQGGGLLAVYDADGRVRFRDHTDEQHQFEYAVLDSTGHAGPAPARTTGEDVTLRLDIAAAGPGRFDLTLTARDTASGALLSRTDRVGVPDDEVVGSMSLVSGSWRRGTPVRHWLHGLRTGGAKVAVHRRAAGPVLGAMHSLTGTVLKLTAQLMPIGAGDPQMVVLQVRSPGAATWTTVQETSVGAGYTALFRVTRWDSARDWEYRVGYAPGTPAEAFFAGTVRRDPQDKGTLSVAMANCTIHSYRGLDRRTSGAPRLPGERFLGLYTPRNLYFPYAATVRGISRLRPDLFVFLGDHYYENKPTRTDRSEPMLDVLYRHLLWLWSFGEITRDTPTIGLVDDHDVYQPNLWGWSGRAAPNADPDLGGYVMPAWWVNLVQRLECGHDPDPFDPTPVRQGIGVYYGTFSYGGVSFAVLEDRKFKNTNRSGLDRFGHPLPRPRRLLGRRQERFLAAWADMHPGQPKVCLSQTMLACVQTDAAGRRVADPDSNGAPVRGRRTAVRLLKRAGALVLSGDQHLASLVRHGIHTHTDGPVQFCVPAAGTAFQRWFEPAEPLPGSSGPNTGDYTDGFGNRFRVLAVANPRITLARVRAAQRGNDIGDRDLKREGYGVVEVDKESRVFRIHCWPWDADPTAAGAEEYAGWPFTLPFSDV